MFILETICMSKEFWSLNPVRELRTLEILIQNDKASIDLAAAPVITAGLACNLTLRASFLAFESSQKPSEAKGEALETRLVWFVDVHKSNQCCEWRTKTPAVSNFSADSE